MAKLDDLDMAHLVDNLKEMGYFNTNVEYYDAVFSDNKLHVVAILNAIYTLFLSDVMQYSLNLRSYLTAAGATDNNF